MRCPSCNQKVRLSDDFCPGCGRKIDQEDEALKKPWVKASPEQPMTHCGRCNRQVSMAEDADWRCPDCGAEIHDPTGRFCPNCGTQMQDAADTCVVCGTEIKYWEGTSAAKSLIDTFFYRGATGLPRLSLIGYVLVIVLVFVSIGLYALFLALKRGLS